MAVTSIDEHGHDDQRGASDLRNLRAKALVQNRVFPNLPVRCKVGAMDTQETKPLNIGSVAEATGLPAKTIRYYESIGLVGPARRTGGNYRLYGERDVSTLRFIERARRLGFSLKEVAELLALWRDRHRASADVRRLAVAQIRRVDARLSELQDMRRSLQHLMERCHGDEHPDYPILEELAAERVEGPLSRGACQGV